MGVARALKLRSILCPTTRQILATPLADSSAKYSESRTVHVYLANKAVVSHGQAIARSTGLLSRLELVCDSCQLFD